LIIYFIAKFETNLFGKNKQAEIASVGNLC